MTSWFGRSLKVPQSASRGEEGEERECLRVPQRTMSRPTRAHVLLAHAKNWMRATPSGRNPRGSGKEKPAKDMAAYMRARRAETTAARKAAADALTRASHHPFENFFRAAACLIQRCKRRIEHQLGRRKRDRGAVRCQPDERRHSRLQRHGSCPGAAPFSSCAQELAWQTPNLSNGERMIRRAN